MSEQVPDTVQGELQKGEKVVKRLPVGMNGMSIEYYVNIVARKTKQSLRWCLLDGEPVVITTGDTYSVLRELRSVLPRERFRTGA